MPSSIAPSLMVLSLLASQTTATAQDSPLALDAKPIAMDATVHAVTLFLGRASVTRTASVPLSPGAYELRFSDLPATIQPQTIHARTSGSTKVVSVDFAQQAQVASSSPPLVKQDSVIEDLQRQIKEIADQREVLKSQDEFLSAVTIRATADAGKTGGTDKLDLDAVRKQLAFVAEERGRMMASKRELDGKQSELERRLNVEQAHRNDLAGMGNTSRTAAVTVVVTEAGPCTIDLTYLVSDATWRPSYNIRADLAGSTAAIEYDAILMQRSGEDWNDVKLTLSTAQPAIAANPPALQPWFVDVRQPAPAEGLVERRAGRMESGSEAPAAKAPPPAPPSMRGDAEADKAALEQLSADANVAGSGPSVTFEIPRTVTVKTNSQKQQRTRIASIDCQPQFVHVAVPMLTDAVYLRCDLTNGSAYQLLPGNAAIFIGQDYVGPTMMPSVAPGGQFEVFLGIEQSVKATRQLVSKKTENTGLLGGGRRTSYAYRIEIDNGSGKPLDLELWDRIPISRSSDIQIEAVDLSDKLATDPQYAKEQQPEGLLKWMLSIPSIANGKNARAVTWGVRINRAKDVDMTALPE